MTNEKFIFNLGPPMLLGGSNNTVIDIMVLHGSNININCNISASCPLPTNISLSVTGGSGIYDLTDIRTMMFSATSSASYTCRADNGQTVSNVYMVNVMTPIPTLCKSLE